MIPKPLLNEILADPFYKVCIRAQENSCQGRVTFEHTLIFAGKQVQEKFAIVPLCAFHHDVNEFQDGGDLVKEIGQLVALNRASKVELIFFSKSINYFRLRDYLRQKYPHYANVGKKTE